MLEICSDLYKTDLKTYFFVNMKKGQKMAKWPNHFTSGKQFQKGQMATLLLTTFNDNKSVDFNH